jgi:hypothetical protein
LPGNTPRLASLSFSPHVESSVESFWFVDTAHSNSVRTRSRASTIYLVLITSFSCNRTTVKGLSGSVFGYTLSFALHKVAVWGFSAHIKKDGFCFPDEFSGPISCIWTMPLCMNGLADERETRSCSCFRCSAQLLIKPVLKYAPEELPK